MIKEITVAKAKEMNDAFFLDVREQDEWDAGHIEGATLFPLSKLKEGERPTLPTDQDVIIYCKSGGRSSNAVQVLQSEGHENLYNMLGGFTAWDD